MVENKYKYEGSELELFRDAYKWKGYLQEVLKHYLIGEILEVGAGIGGTTVALCNGDGKQKRYVCLEPDPVLESILSSLINEGKIPRYCETKVGTLSSIDSKEKFDSILYIDVLEHIKNDKDEINLAASHLRDNGYLVVLVPAHQWLYSPFDKTIGHYRRYSRKSLQRIISKNFECISLKYLDSVGLCASLCNKLLFKQNMPKKQQILLWDKLMVPFSKVIDPLFRYNVGKSVVGVWMKNN